MPAEATGHDGSDPVVAAARAGDRRAWADLYARLAPVVHGVLLARVGKTDADDLTQEVFMRAMRQVGQLREDGAIGAWLANIARNEARDHGRRGRRSGGLLRLVGLRGGGGRADARMGTVDGARQEAERVLAAIRSLPEAYHETLVLRRVEGLTGPQIAAALGMTHGSVRVNLTRGMEMLRTKLGARPSHE
jgi:RNA polymerase sigma-70 factor (ECF subfamily)